MSATPARDPRPLLARTAALGGWLMVAIVASSAFLRLTSIGIGCEPWPECYGRLATLQNTGIDLGTATGLARLLHRISAMTVAFVVAFALVLSLAARAARTPGNIVTTIALTILTLVLAVVGRQSAGTVVPMVGLVNLVGGFAMLALFGLLWAANRTRSTDEVGSPLRRIGLAVILGVVVLQVALGAMVSVTYSALSCSGVFECHVQGDAVWKSLRAFAPAAPLAIDPSGRVLAPAGAAELQLVHRVLGVAIGAALVLVGAIAGARKSGRAAGTRIALAGAVVSLVGIVMVLSGFVLSAALAHNLVAAALVSLLALMIVAPRSTSRRSG